RRLRGWCTPSGPTPSRSILSRCARRSMCRGPVRTGTSHGRTTPRMSQPQPPPPPPRSATTPPQSPPSEATIADEVMRSLAQQIGVLTCELAARSALLRQAEQQIEFLRQQLAERDAQRIEPRPSNAEPSSSSVSGEP